MMMVMRLGVFTTAPEVMSLRVSPPGVEPTGRECERLLSAYQSYLDINAVDQEFILQEQVNVETANHVDDMTPDDVRSSSHEPCISCGPGGDLHGTHASGRVLVPQLI